MGSNPSFLCLLVSLTLINIMFMLYFAHPSPQRVIGDEGYMQVVHSGFCEKQLGIRLSSMDDG